MEKKNYAKLSISNMMLNQHSKRVINKPSLVKIKIHKPLERKKAAFLNKYLHLLGAIFSLVAIIISYHFWKDETQWVVKWTIIYTIFALFYWSIKPIIKRIREKWTK